MKLQTKALETLLEYSTYCKFQFTSEVVGAMHSFLTQHYTSLSLAHSQKLMEAIAMVISAIDSGNFATNLHQVIALPMQSLKSINDLSNREDLLKGVSLLTSATKAVDDLPSFDLAPVLLPLFQDAWPSLCQILQGRHTDTGLVDACCDYLIRTARALKTELTQHFTVIQQ